MSVPKVIPKDKASGYTNLWWYCTTLAYGKTFESKTFLQFCDFTQLQMFFHELTCSAYMHNMMALDK